MSAKVDPLYRDGCAVCGVPLTSTEPCRRFIWRTNRHTGFVELYGSEPIKRKHAARVRAAKEKEGNEHGS